MGVHASNNERSYSENVDYPLKVSEIKDLRNPAKPWYRNELDLNATIISKGDSEEENYLIRKRRSYSWVRKDTEIQHFITSQFQNSFNS